MRFCRQCLRKERDWTYDDFTLFFYVISLRNFLPYTVLLLWIYPQISSDWRFPEDVLQFQSDNFFQYQEQRKNSFCQSINDHSMNVPVGLCGPQAHKPYKILYLLFDAPARIILPAICHALLPFIDINNSSSLCEIYPKSYSVHRWKRVWLFLGCRSPLSYASSKEWAPSTYTPSSIAYIFPSLLFGVCRYQHTGEDWERVYIIWYYRANSE